MATEDKRIDQLDPVAALDLTGLMAMQQGSEAKKVTVQQLLDYLNAQIGTGNAVLFVSQTLSDDQKRQARTNIGAAASGEGGGGTLEGAVLYTEQRLTEEQQKQARENIRCGIVGISRNCVASGLRSSAQGEETEATGNYSHSEGQDTLAGGSSSHAEGRLTEATGKYSHSEGFYTEATGESSHAEGYYTDANGRCSHAEGYYTDANGNYSHVEGFYTVATSWCQHVIGTCNVADESGEPEKKGKYVYIVGNGTADDARSNAHTLDWAGVPWFAGDRVMLGGTGMDDEAAVALMPVFVPQELTEEQKAQARANIGVDAYIEQVFLGGAW